MDVGCGIGTWLRRWREIGVADVWGIDGGHIAREQLLFESAHFLAMDLSNPQNPFKRQFDLAESLEVGEHIPERSSRRFVEMLCELAPIVLFSAAIPHQGGTLHVNEQWPEYWARLFSDRGFLAFDVLRPSAWRNEAIAYYYAQNAILYVRSDVAAREPTFRDNRHLFVTQPMALVHPRKWEAANTQPLPLERVLRMIPSSTFGLATRIRRRLARVSV